MKKFNVYFHMRGPTGKIMEVSVAVLENKNINSCLSHLSNNNFEYTIAGNKLEVVGIRIIEETEDR